MIRFHAYLHFAIAVIFLNLVPSVLRAQEGTVVRNGVKELIQILTSQAEKKGAGALAKEVAEVGGETGMREILEQVAKEEGEAGVKALVKLTKEYGIDAIQA